MSEQAPLWVATTDLPRSPGHPFDARLKTILDAAGFDAFVEERARSFYAPVMGRPGLAPGRYFRLLLVGYFEDWTGSAGSPGGAPTRWPCGASSGWGLTRQRPIIRRSRARGA